MGERTITPLISAVVAMILTACGHAPMVFRLTTPVNAAPGSMAITPPGIKDAAVSQAKVPVARGAGPCPASPHGLTAAKGRILVTKDALSATTGAELIAWTRSLETAGCIGLNTAFPVADAIVDALPLDRSRRAILRQGRTDLRAGTSINVISPVLKAGAKYEDPTVTEVAAGDNPMSIAVRAEMSSSILGYEIDWYDVVARDGEAGYRIVPRSAEIHVNGSVDRRTTPTTLRFAFPTEARWFELNMMLKVSTNDNDYVVYSAPTISGLEETARHFQSNAEGLLATMNPSEYSLLPHGSGINAFVHVTVNGTGLDLPRGSTVRQAIVQAKGDPATVTARMKLRKMHAGALYPVEWGGVAERVLGLELEGGETVDWK